MSPPLVGQGKEVPRMSPHQAGKGEKLRRYEECLLTNGKREGDIKNVSSPSGKGEEVSRMSPNQGKSHWEGGMKNASYLPTKQDSKEAGIQIVSFQLRGDNPTKI